MKSRTYDLLWLMLAAIMCGALCGGALSAQEVAPIVPFDAQTAAAIADPWVSTVAREHPWIVTMLVVIGALRTLFKPLMAVIQMRVDATPDPEDNAWLTSLRSQSWYRLLTWTLDFGASIKLPPPASRFTEGSAVIGRSANLIAFACLLVCGGLLLPGCASFKTTQSEKRNETDGTTHIETRVAARTLFTSKSQLTSFSAVQTEGKQGASVGSLTQQSSGTNAVRALEALDSILGKIR